MNLATKNDYLKVVTGSLLGVGLLALAMASVWPSKDYSPVKPHATVVGKPITLVEREGQKRFEFKREGQKRFEFKRESHGAQIVSFIGSYHTISGNIDNRIEMCDTNGDGIVDFERNYVNANDTKSVPIITKRPSEQKSPDFPRFQNMDKRLQEFYKREVKHEN